MWAASSLSLFLSCSRIFVPFFLLFLLQFFFLQFLTWYPLPGPLLLRPFASTSSSLSCSSFFVSWLEYPGIYYFRLLSLSLNFASCSSFLGPYLDSASSTLLAPLAYTLFLLRLRSWFCYPRSFAFFESKEVPLLVFLSLPIFIISLYRSCSLNTVFLRTILALFFCLYFFISPDIYYFIMSPLLWNWLCLFRNVYILPRYSSLFALYLNPVPHWPCSSFLSKGTITTSLAFATCHSLYLFYLFISALLF